jgi:phosphoglycerol transferase
VAGGGSPADDAPRRLLDGLSLFVGVCLLVGSIGSLSYLASALGLRPIRAWNRISIVIEFCALAAVAVMIDRLPAVVAGRRRLLRGVAALVPVAVLAVGLLDQTSPADRPDYSAIHRQYTGDRDFFQAVADQLPAGTPVYQMPFVPFPEGSRPGVGSYDEGRAFVFQPQLAWSYGFMAGRHPAYPIALERQPPAQWLPAVTAIGFRGIVVDNDAYGTGTANPCGELARLTGDTGLVSRDRRYTFFDLRAYAGAIARSTSPSALTGLAAQALRGT